MAQIQLSTEEREELKNARRKRNSKISERCLYVLLLDEGKSISEISRVLNRTRQTIQRWTRIYAKQGIEGLVGSSPPGRKNLKGHVVEEFLEELCNRSPRDFGYLEEAWSADLFVDYFRQQNLEVSPMTVKRALKKQGWVYKRFQKTVPSQAQSPEEKRLEIEALVDEIELEDPEKQSEIFFVDESHFSNEPYVERGWLKKGEKKNRNSKQKRK